MDSALQPLRIRAELSSSAFTRTESREDDGFTVLAFTNGDKAGFFSEAGGVNNGPFTNAPMTFTSGYFTDDNNTMADINRVGKTILYYPYSAAENGRQPLRQENGEVIDLLYSTTVGDVDEGSLVAHFYHTFSMFIIDGGLGFENLQKNNPEITIVMEKPLETVEIQRDESEIGYKIAFNGAYTDDTQPDDSFANFTGHYNPEDNRYYVMVPNDGVTAVKSINVKDDSGRLHKIKWPQGGLEYGKKYPITLELDEMIPVINLHKIVPWDENVDLEANRQKGIGTRDEFMTWMAMYNADPTDENLSNYGDKIEIVDDKGNLTGETYWHFMLTADIDFTGLNDASYFISNLVDCLDGCGHSMSNITLATGENAALFENINGKYARVENLVIDGVWITTTGSEPVGTLAKTFNQGTIRNCSLRALHINATSSAGVIAGRLGTGGVGVEKCSAAGTILAADTEEKIVGVAPLYVEVRKGCEASNVMFGRK